MGDWNFLGGILEEVHIHSTIVGKIWLTILFIFRMLVLGVAAEDVWNDEQAEFICNTAQPGCRNVCYDKAFPISLIRYWVLQVIFVSSPSLVYMGHALYRLRALEKERQKKKAQLRRELAVDIDLVEVRKKLERELRQLEQRKLNKAPLRGSLLRTYVMHIVTRSGVEVGFMVGQYFLYGFQLDPLFKCEREPCPEVVDCFVSRPTEKTVFMMFMQCIAALSLFLNILEVIHLGYKKLKNGILDYYPNLRDDLDDYDVSKSKKNSVIQQVCIGMSTGRKATIPTAPSGYTLLMEKQGDAPLYPILNPSSAFMPIQGDPNGNTNSCPESHKESSIQSAGEQNSSSNNTVLNKSPKANSLPKQGEQDDHSHSTARHSGGDRLSEGPGESGSSLYPALQGELSSCPTMQVSSSRKPRRVSAPWNCTTVVESNGSNGDGAVSSSHQGRCSFSATKARAASKSDLKRLSRPDTPDSTGESSSESKQSRNCDSPQALSPARRMSLASNASSRRAPTDLQI